MAVRIADKILAYLKENTGVKVTPKEIALAIGANPNTVRGRLSDLTQGKIKVGKTKVKLSKIKSKKKGEKRKAIYRFTETQSDRISKFKRWRVDFKINETKKGRWKRENMNLEGYVFGIVPRDIDEEDVKSVVGSKLSQECLRVYFREIGSDESSLKEFHTGIDLINDNPLDEKYGLGVWEGKVELIGSTGEIATEDIRFKVKQSEYEE